ncbi:unnamed protein product [Gongylonema pulchrum]|uniref:Dirigent protein n=1 Tax=Gongylonema pulchrum TaxID=637853 RepID=A0A183E8B0_9BILA|nr:unnamed protein product [Gongylonema pulchrum]
MPLAMAGDTYAFSAPPPAVGGMTTVYFIPVGSELRGTGWLMALQASVQLALSATANASFVIFVFVQKLPTSSIGPKTDLGSYMPNPLLDTKCRGFMDYHVSMLLETEKYVVTQASTCVRRFSVYGESGYEKLYIRPPQAQNVLLHKIVGGLNAGINSRRKVHLEGWHIFYSICYARKMSSQIGFQTHYLYRFAENSDVQEQMYQPAKAGE